MAMDIVADRFVLSDDGAYDLATGETLVLRTSAAGGPTDQMRWAIRCDWLARLWHPALAELVDYGPFGESQRFEAWRCGRPWAGGAEGAECAVRHVNAFLLACGRSGVERIDADVREHGGRPVVVVSPSAGYPAETGPQVLPLEAHGLSIVSRRSVAALTENLGLAGVPRAQVLGLAGAAGAGVTTAIRAVARAARMEGLVPVRLGQPIDDAVADRLHARSLLLIDERIGARDERWKGLLEWTLRSAGTHVLLAVSTLDDAGPECVRLEPIGPEALCQAVVPPPGDVRMAERVREAGRRAQGLPARFVAALWQPYDESHRRGPRWLSRAAERHVAYVAAPARIHGTVSAGPWPTLVPTADLGRRVWQAEALLDRGRHAPGVRGLRASAAALQRRGAWAEAAQAFMALGKAILTRGQATAAQEALREAEVCASRSSQDVLLLDIAVLMGQSAIDLARLEDAERTLSAAIAAARGWQDGPRHAQATLALARCLFWRGQYRESLRHVETLACTDLPTPVRAQAMIAHARAALGGGDLSAAIRSASAAGEVASTGTCHRLAADAALAAALVHLVLGDRLAVGRDVATAIRVCRAAHDPLGALKARLIAAECQRRHGQCAAAVALLARTRGLVSRLPPLVLRRRDLLADLVAAGARTEGIVERHVAQTGLGALRVLGAPIASGTTTVEAELAADVLDILRSCQTADEERSVLGRVCARIRDRLQAVAVGIAVPERDGPALLVADGRLDARMASRVIDAQQSIPPHRWDETIEGGAPIPYGGEVVGAVVGRWAVASPPDGRRAAVVFSLAATAVAPILAAALARRAAARAAEPDNLLGVSPGLTEVRRAIERAASAPFPVLVEGESGSGKELVARALHRRSARRDRPFCTVNCAALPDELIESELFGHARGAFTGAAIDRAGVFEEAHGGTLFLDEIGELSLRAQAKILRTLQEGEVRRVGENVPRRVDVRVVAATNRSLRGEVAAGRFRLDLLYRLDVVGIALPPLRDRREDIPILAQAFWQEASARVGSRATLAAPTVAALTRHDWPGNVRELQNVLAALAVRGPRRGAIPPEALPPTFGPPEGRSSCRLDEARRTFDARFVRAALVRAGGRRGRAAAELGVSRQGLSKLMGRLGISDAAYNEARESGTDRQEQNP